jgi:hypothetical protein
MTNATINQNTKTECIKTILNVIAADRKFDPSEIQKIYTIFSLTNTKKEERLELLSHYIKNGCNKEYSTLTPVLLDSEHIKIELAKELTKLEQDAANKQTLTAAKNYLTQIKLTNEQANVIQKFVTVENNILQAMGAGKEWISDENSLKELTSRAAAVGIPLTALNIAGITGFSAVGITSGLATLGGLSGLTILGLNPMTAGIGALILGGVTVKKISDFALKGSDETNKQIQKAIHDAQLKNLKSIISDLTELKKYKKRELFLFPRMVRRRALIQGLKRTISES